MTAPLDHHDPRWFDHAACLGENVNVFYFEDTTPNYQARRYCITCPVRLDCLEYATEHEKDWGVWAGFTARVRLMIRGMKTRTGSKSVQELLVKHPDVVLKKYPAPKRTYRRDTNKLMPISTNAMFQSVIEAAKIREAAEASRRSEVPVTLAGSSRRKEQTPR